MSSSAGPSAAAFLRAEKLYDKTGFSPAWIHNREIDFDMTARIKNAPCLINSKWNGRRFFTLAGGGVSIVPADACKKENLQKISPKDFEDNKPDLDENESWWWHE